jgi:hypothetical protein
MAAEEGLSSSVESVWTSDPAAVSLKTIITVVFNSFNRVLQPFASASLIGEKSRCTCPEYLARSFTFYEIVGDQVTIEGAGFTR